MHRQSLRKLKGSFLLSHVFEQYAFYLGLAQRHLGILLLHLQSDCGRDWERVYLKIVTSLGGRSL